MKIRGTLRGNDGRAQRLELPEDVEMQFRAGIRDAGGKTVFALPPEDVHDLLDDLRDLLARTSEGDWIVVTDSELRPYVRRLIRLEFPDVPVLARDEIADPPGAAPSSGLAAAEHSSI